MWQRPGLVADWLQQNGQEVRLPLTISRVGFGQSNITTLIADADELEWVMREPPPGEAVATAHDIKREATILRRLSTSGVPVPRVIGTGDGPSGSPFLVMNRVPGAALETEAEARALTPAQRHALGISVAETLGRLHRLDPTSLGVNVSRTPYLLRQLRRVAASWDLHGRADIHDASWERVRSGLADELPGQSTPVIMHGDFRLSNLLVREGVITAVLDWELCTVGDALADLAWLLDDWRAPADPRIVMPSPTRAGGFPDREEMVTVYRDVTGFDVSNLDYYRAFSQWRAASLLQGVLARRQAGAMGSHGEVDPAALHSSIDSLLSSAMHHLAATS